MSNSDKSVSRLNNCTSLQTGDIPAKHLSVAIRTMVLVFRLVVVSRSNNRMKCLARKLSRGARAYTAVWSALVLLNTVCLGFAQPGSDNFTNRTTISGVWLSVTGNNQ